MYEKLDSPVKERLIKQSLITFALTFPVSDLSSCKEVFYKTGFVKIDQQLLNENSRGKISDMIKTKSNDFKGVLFFCDRFPDTETLRNLLLLSAPYGIHNCTIVVKGEISEEDLFKILSVSNQVGNAVFINISEKSLQEFAFDYWLSHGRINIYPAKDLFRKILYVYGYSSKSSVKDYLSIYSEDIINQSLFLSLAYEKIISDDLKTRLVSYLSSKIQREKLEEMFSVSLPENLLFCGDETYKVYNKVVDFYEGIEKGILYINVIVPLDFLFDLSLRKEKLPCLRLFGEILVDVCEKDKRVLLNVLKNESDPILNVPLTLLFEPLEDDLSYSLFENCIEQNIPVFLVIKPGLKKEIIRDFLRSWLNFQSITEVQPFAYLIKKNILKNLGMSIQCKLLDQLFECYGVDVELVEDVCIEWLNSLS